MSELSADEVANADAAPKPFAARKALRSRWVLLGLFTLFCAMLGGFWAAYRFLVYYERRAALHLPVGTEVAVRLDLEQVVLFEPFRQHILGAAKRWVTAAEWTDLGDRLGINFGMDLREVLVAGQPLSGEGKSRWVVVVAGLFPKTGLLEELSAWLQEHGRTGCLIEGAQLTCEAFGLVARQAGDGAIVIGPDAQVLQEALTPSQRYEALGLQPGNGAMELGWHPAVGALRVANLPSWVPGASFASEVGAVDGRLLLESDAIVQFRLSTAPGIDVQRLAKSTESMRLTLQSLLAFSGPEVVGEKTLLSRASVAIDPNNPDKVLVQSVWERRDIDRAAQALGDLLWGWSQQHSAGP